jgi:hypothetical protein
MPTPAETVDLLAGEPGGARAEALAVMAAAEAHRSWVAARESKWARYLDSLPKDPSSPAKDLAGELEREQKVGSGQAKKRATRAEQLGELPETEQALEAGGITDAHADAMTRARAKADSKARAALEAHEAELLGHAAGESPWEFQKRLERFVQRHSDDDGRSSWDKAKARERLALTPNGDGMTRINGLLAPELAQRARRVLGSVSDELYRRDHQDHPADQAVPFTAITNEQRQAHALDEILRRAEQVNGPTDNKDRAVVVLSYDDLVGRDGPLANTSTLMDGTPVPASVARRMACDAGKIPFTLGGESVKLDLGRARRGASPAQDLALELLWSTCSFADCTAPIAWSQMHHLDPFNEDGHQGGTDLGNLTPACAHRCHDLAHTPGWSFTKDPVDHSTTTVAPDGTTWHRMPNGPGVKDRPAEPPPAAADPTVPDSGEPAATFTEAA